MQSWESLSDPSNKKTAKATYKTLKVETFKASRLALKLILLEKMSRKKTKTVKHNKKFKILVIIEAFWKMRTNL